MTETLEIVRSIDAPRDRIWEAWIDPEKLRHWWWPARFRTSYELDVRHGGSYRFLTADLPDFGRLDLNGRYLDVRPRELLSYTWHWGDADELTRVTVAFSPGQNVTELRVRQEGFNDIRERANHEVGWRDCLDRLSAYAHALAGTP